tara:strand:- start:648 stop:800 length:153 start_codon:yes stop_codon:yes gene_type:complete
MNEENKEVRVTDIDISFKTVLKLVFQFALASVLIGGTMTVVSSLVFDFPH